MSTAIKVWYELSDREQEEAIAILHQHRGHSAALTPQDRRLLSIAADFLEAHRRKFKAEP